MPMHAPRYFAHPALCRIHEFARIRNRSFWHRTLVHAAITGLGQLFVSQHISLGHIVQQLQVCLWLAEYGPVLQVLD